MTAMTTILRSWTVTVALFPASLRNCTAEPEPEAALGIPLAPCSTHHLLVSKLIVQLTLYLSSLRVRHCSRTLGFATFCVWLSFSMFVKWGLYLSWRNMGAIKLTISAPQTQRQARLYFQSPFCSPKYFIHLSQTIFWLSLLRGFLDLTHPESHSGSVSIVCYLM